MSNPATTNDIVSRWRALDEQESGVAIALLGDAWDILLSRRPQLEADLLAGTVTDVTVRRVLAAMVIRVLKNPDGYDSETQDDWTGRRSTLAASGLLTVTPDELADITPGRKSRRSLRMVAYGDDLP